MENEKLPVSARQAALERIKIQYPAELPVSARAADIRALWEKHPLVIVGGATGSGKTTQLPKIALELGGGRRGRIGCTQPRRIAADAMARRLASELGVEFGAGVGCQVRFEDRTADATFLKFMTDGILLAETRRDRDLRQYDTLIIDEAHERSLNIDFLLGYLKGLLARRKDLRVAISSATLDMEQFSAFFGGAPVIEVEGRAYPVEDLYLPPEADEDLPDHVGRAVRFLSDLDPRGDMLVFLPGEREIRECEELLEGWKLPNTEVLPLYARLAATEQQRVFHPGRARRIVLATNVAETSLTIPRIRYCIDSGQARISRYNARTGIQELRIEMISQAAARQRRGRCGRTADGICAHLYSEDDLARSAAYTDPEIKRTSLAGVILQMATLQLPRIEHFPLLDPPSSALIREGMRTLTDLQAITPSGRPTTDGWNLAVLPVDPHMGKILLAAAERSVLQEALVIVSYLSIVDPRERPAEKRQAADDAHRKWRDESSDFLAILNCWRAVAAAGTSNSLLRKFCRDNFLNYMRVREWRNLAADLSQRFAQLHKKRAEPVAPGDVVPYDALHEALLAGIPRNLALYDAENRQYIAAGNRKFHLFPGSGLNSRKKPAEWLLAFALVETTRVFARQAAEVKPAYFERVAPHLCVRVFDQAHYEPASGFVRARERLTFGGLLIHAGRKIDYARSHPVEAREIFIREGLLAGEAAIPGHWSEKFRKLREDLLKLELKIRRPDSVYDSEAAARYFLEKLPSEIHSLQSLRASKGSFLPPRENVMQEQYFALDPDAYPDFMDFDGLSLPLEYRFDPGAEEDGITMCVRESELNLLPRWALDYPVEGFLNELIETLLRGLSKERRRVIGVISEAAALFAEMRKSGAILAGQPLAEALSDFLRDEFELSVPPRDFDAVRRPEYLRLKLAVLNAQGRRIELLREMPNQTALGSQLSRTLPGVGKFTRSGLLAWPPGEALPESLPLPGSSGRTAFPALTDEQESIGIQLFLKLPEARARHRAGVLCLFKLMQANQLKFIRRSLVFSNEMRLSWFLEDRGKRYEGDLLDSVIEHALGGDTWGIRSADVFADALEDARQHLGEAADSRMNTLNELYAQYAALDALRPKLRARAPEGAAALSSHLALLFSPGFLRREAVWSDYRRYLRGLQLRAARMLDQPSRDAEKGADLQPYFDRFALALSAVGELTDAPELYAFWKLLEECRLARFAPEVPTAIRAPLGRLEEAWDKLRY